MEVAVVVVLPVAVDDVPAVEVVAPAVALPEPADIRLKLGG